jgi:cyclopropane fatty-acyl-phospholipid synthase-like methyltransferase
MDFEARPEPARDAWDAFWERAPDDQRLLQEDAIECVRNLEAVVPLSPTMRALDFGCGWGNVARLLGPKVGELYLWDDAPRMRTLAAEATAQIPNVRMLTLKELTEERSFAFDLILANSVGQFMTAQEFAHWLRRWGAMLTPAGRIVVSDLVPPNYAALADLMTLLRFSRKRGFLARALWDAARVIPSYWRARKARPLLRTSTDDLAAWGREAGLTGARFVTNLTCFKKRITVIFTKDSRAVCDESLRPVLA